VGRERKRGREETKVGREWKRARASERERLRARGERQERQRGREGESGVSERKRERQDRQTDRQIGRDSGQTDRHIGQTDRHIGGRTDLICPRFLFSHQICPRLLFYHHYIPLSTDKHACANSIKFVKKKIEVCRSKASAMRVVTIPIDLSTRPFISLPRFFNSSRVPPILNQSWVLIPERSA
jgi:hypothetical protein